MALHFLLFITSHGDQSCLGQGPVGVLSPSFWNPMFQPGQITCIIPIMHICKMTGASLGRVPASGMLSSTPHYLAENTFSKSSAQSSLENFYQYPFHPSFQAKEMMSLAWTLAFPHRSLSQQTEWPMHWFIYRSVFLGFNR